MYPDEDYPVYNFVDPDDSVFAEKVVEVDEETALRWRDVSFEFWTMQHELRKLVGYDNA